MNHCYLSLGSNLNSPQRQLRLAINALHALPATYVLKIARFYFNKPQGRKCQPNFYNTVVLLHTRLPPQQLLSKCQTIEQQQGRVRYVKWGSRSIDIDILQYASLTIHSKTLILPHPRMHLRDFVMLPLQEIYSQARKLCTNVYYTPQI